jgi:hypothetical protein
MMTDGPITSPQKNWGAQSRLLPSGNQLWLGNPRTQWRRKNGKINELNGGQVATLKKMPCHVVQCKELATLSPEAIVPYMGRLAATGWVPAG